MKTRQILILVVPIIMVFTAIFYTGLFNPIVVLGLIFLSLILLTGVTLIFIDFKKLLLQPSYTSFQSKPLKKLYFLTLILFTIISPIVSVGFNQAFPDYFVPSSQGSRAAIAHQYAGLISILAIIAIASYWISFLGFRRLSPIGKVLVNVGLLQAIPLAILFIIHFSRFYSLYILVCPLLFPVFSPLVGLVMICSQLIRNHRMFVKEYKKTPFSRLLKKLGFNDLGLSLILLIPFYVIYESILILFTQKPDAFILAFTETCSWTLSQHPCNTIPSSHYLCTVAAQGHPKIVKPLRNGLRYDSVITVNRQLLIANAFEDWFIEKMPRTHRLIRSTYDKTGLPISKFITNKWLSDITYVVMKPLEWFFLLWLYSFDKKPENRIHSQYIGKKVGS